MGLILKSRLGYKHIEWHDEHLRFYPAIAVHMHPHAFVDAGINFGSKPFLFDIEGFFQSWHEKNRQTAPQLPVEILLMMFYHLGHYHKYAPGAYKTAMRNLSSVCHTLHGIFQPKLFDPLVILKQHELKGIAKCLSKNSFKSTTVLIVNEPRSSNHDFCPVSCLLSLFAQKFPFLNELKLYGNDNENFHAPCSAVQRQALSIFIRNNFNHVTSFTLTRFTFLTWCRFAQVICAFPQLDKLKLYLITWNDIPHHPPKWLKTLCHISHVTFDNVNDYGSLWLCLLPTSQRASSTIISEPFGLKSVDAYLIAEISRCLFSIIGSVFSMHCNIHVIDEQTNFRIIKGDYSGIDNELTNTSPEWHLKFEKSILGHELVELFVHCHCCDLDDILDWYLRDLKILNKLISRLSNSATCKCLLKFVCEETSNLSGIQIAAKSFQHLSAHRQSLHLLEFHIFEESSITDSEGEELYEYKEFDEKLLAKVELDESEESEDEDESEAS